MTVRAWLVAFLFRIRPQPAVAVERANQRALDKAKFATARAERVIGAYRRAEATAGAAGDALVKETRRHT